MKPQFKKSQSHRLHTVSRPQDAKPLSAASAKRRRFQTQPPPNRRLHNARPPVQPSPTPEECADLLKGTLTGDVDAFADLYLALKDRVRSFIRHSDRRLCPDDLPDLTHDVFLRLWEKRPAYLTDAPARAFIFAIARNITREHIAKRMRLPMVNMTDLDPDTQLEVDLCQGPPSSPPEPTDMQIRVQSAIARLTPIQRQAVTLAIFARSRSQAAAKANCSPQQLSYTLRNAKRRLRKLLS